MANGGDLRCDITFQLAGDLWPYPTAGQRHLLKKNFNFLDAKVIRMVGSNVDYDPCRRGSKLNGGGVPGQNNALSHSRELPCHHCSGGRMTDGSGG